MKVNSENDIREAFKNIFLYRASLHALFFGGGKIYELNYTKYVI